jgi:hypothetical protein
LIGIVDTSRVFGMAGNSCAGSSPALREIV